MRDGTDATVLLEDGDRQRRIVAMPAYSDAFLAQLEQTEFGSSGLRYRRRGVAEQLARLPNPVFFELHDAGKLTGTYAVARSQVVCGDQQATGLYRGLLTLTPQARGSGQGKLLVTRALQWLRESIGDQAGTVLTWGCIERNNDRSLRLLQSMGAQRLGTLESLLVYRQWPRERIAVALINDTASVAVAFEQSHRGCGLRRLGTAATPFYAVTDHTGIVAGAHVTVTTIDMIRSGSLWDAIYDKLLIRVPAARRRFDPHNFRYLRLADVVVTPGSRGVWRDFLTTLLARHDAHMAMFMLDPRSEAYALLDSVGVFGRFASSTRQHIEVLAHAWNAPAGMLDELAAQPLAIGPLDI